MSGPGAGPVLRRLWGESLAGLNLFPEALSVWPSDDLADRVRRAELALLAGQPRNALGLLREVGPTRAGSVEQHTVRVLHQCALSLGGDRAAFPRFLTDAVKLQPSVALSRLVALAAAGSGRMPIAGTAAWHALRDGCGDHRLLVIAAAAAATERRYPDAVVLAEEAEHCRLPARQDAAETTVNLLRHVGREHDALALAAVGAHAWTLPADRRRTWVALTRPLLPPRRRRRFLRPHTPGLDPETSRLIQLHRRQRWRNLPVSAIDVLTPAAVGWTTYAYGAGLLLAGGPWLDAAALAAGLAGLPAAVGVVRWRGARRFRAHRYERHARAARRDTSCQCHGTVAWLGPEARHYVGHHLVPLDVAEPPVGVPARLLRCPATGATFLDLPDRPATVRVPAATDSHAWPAAAGTAA